MVKRDLLRLYHILHTAKIAGCHVLSLGVNFKPLNTSSLQLRDKNHLLQPRENSTFLQPCACHMNHFTVSLISCIFCSIMSTLLLKNYQLNLDPIWYEKSTCSFLVPETLENASVLLTN